MGLCVFLVFIWFVDELEHLPKLAEGVVGEAGICIQEVRLLSCLLRLSHVTTRTGPHYTH